MQLIYGTGNHAKLSVMKRALQGLPFEIQGLKEAAAQRGVALPQVEEEGKTVLENARYKAESYYRLFGTAVFSCDSGLYLWNHETGDMLPEEEQPGIHVRGRGAVRLSDDDLIAHYTGLVKRYGTVRARYKNAICLIIDENTRRECEEEMLWGGPFLLADKPHGKQVKGFPIDSISIDIDSGMYYYDMENNAQDQAAADRGFRTFFEEIARLFKLC